MPSITINYSNTNFSFETKKLLDIAATNFVHALNQELAKNKLNDMFYIDIRPIDEDEVREEVNLTSIIPIGIEITREPNKKEYKAGSKFNKAGMLATVKYSNGATLIVKGSDLDLVSDKALTAKDTSVTLLYTELGVTLSAEQPITVK